VTSDGTKIRRAAGALALSAGMLIGGVGLGHALATSGSAPPGANSRDGSGTNRSGNTSSGQTCPPDANGTASSSA
jgi:hypothetical protein